jgi:hypothetical protein
MSEPFVVRHYATESRPIIKGNGFDGLEIGEERTEAEEFIAWVNNTIADRDLRIEALTKALRGLTGCTKEITNALNACALFSVTDKVARDIALKMVKEAKEAVDTANALLASAAGAEGEA